MKILHLSPELAPWSKAGGLGDAVAALAKAMGALGHEVRVVTPLYGSVPGAERMGVLLPSLQVGVGGAAAAAGRAAVAAAGRAAVAAAAAAGCAAGIAPGICEAVLRRPLLQEFES